MKDLSAKCGINCGRCPSYKENLITEEDRKRCSKGWYTYHGFQIKAEPCGSCQIPPGEKLTYRVCPISHIRTCTLKNGVKTCAHCSLYPCEALRKHKDISREEVAARLGTPIPEEDYLAFIEPYEGLEHLEEIHASLNPEEIVNVAKIPPSKSRIVGFPEDLPFSKDDTRMFKKLHQLLSAINTITADSYATQELLKKRRKYSLKLLWTFGRFGELTQDGTSYLTIDDEDYFGQNLDGRWAAISQYFERLKEYGVHCTHVPLGDGWLLPSGWLRAKTKSWDKGWLMRMTIDDEAGGYILNALIHYTARLDEKYNKRAFRYFSKADMRVLKEE
ncbi:MAG: hypothetical protein AYK18_02630 [Theionarchaea archaeon DG-70]|nr:MAG: hypothetical protein AYK18_02630 [Theionarchaea archaeon DG-70]